MYDTATQARTRRNNDFIIFLQQREKEEEGLVSELFSCDRWLIDGDGEWCDCD
jgi:hypothetical protein